MELRQGGLEAPGSIAGLEEKLKKISLSDASDSARARYCWDFWRSDIEASQVSDT